jgi:dihydrofolate synthase/folylpolyglutamate synthase
LTDLPVALERLDRLVNHEVTSSKGIAAGSIDGLSLEPMKHLVGLLGDPQTAYPIIHITGTNGKGAVTAMVAKLIEATDLTAGSYTSPHLGSINERICRNGEPIGDDDLAEALTGVLDVADLLEQPPTWFEVVTATAFRWFAEAGIDVAVIEVGLLGRFDATNVASADVAVITNVGRDHTDMRPGWEGAIASEKAGIIEPGSTVVLGPVSSEVRSIVEAEGPESLAAVDDQILVHDDQIAMGGHVLDIETPWARHTGLYVPLHGAAQANNAAVAVAAAEAFFNRELSDDVAEAGLASVELTGRCEVLTHQPLVVFDGAHNPDAGEHLIATLDTEFSVAGSRVLVLGVLDGRDQRAFAESLAPYGWDGVILTTPTVGRGLAADVLERDVASVFPGDITVVAEPAQAMARALAHAQEEDLVAVTGSFYLYADAVAAVRAAGLNLPG